MASETAVSWPWLFQLSPQASESLKEGQKELIDDEADLVDLDFTIDECPNKVTGCVAFIDKDIKTESPSGADDIVEVNFTDQRVNLPAFVAALYAVDATVIASNIRYVGIVGGNQEDVACDDHVVLLSIWVPKGRAIVNIYLRMESVKDSLMLANSISKLLYEACEKSAVRQQKFRLVRSGVVSVSLCSTEERDVREKQEFDKSKEKNGSRDDTAKTNGTEKTLESDSVSTKDAGEKTEELKPLEETKMFFTLDEESLCLFDHPLSPKPIWDFRFYKESWDNSIDVIYISNTTGELEIEQQQKVFYIKSMKKEEGSDDEDFTDLSKTLQDGGLKPKPSVIFTDLNKFVEFYNKGQSQKAKPASDKKPSHADSHQSHPPAQPAPSRPVHLNPQQKKDSLSWLSNLQTGSHLQNGDEELQIMWFQIEHELQRCIAENLVPEVDITSAGLDPENAEQLQTAVEDIRDKLLNNNYPQAVSLLRATINVFKGTHLKSIASIEEVELLKRIFFLTE